MSNAKPEDASWKWRYSGLTGIMYGPIPVGIIVVVVGGILYFTIFQ